MNADAEKLTKEECAIRRNFLFRLIAEEDEQERRHRQKAAFWDDADSATAPTAHEMAAQQRAFCANGAASLSTAHGHKQLLRK